MYSLDSLGGAGMLGKWAFDFTYEEGTWQDTFIVYLRTADGYRTGLWQRDNTDPDENWRAIKC
jgi:hypothetical protein